MIQENILKSELSPEKIIVIGVGGGGGNAINYMCQKGIENTDFLVCNTDIEGLEKSVAPIKIQLGDLISGAEGNPEKGREAALNSAKKIRAVITADTKIVIIIAGLGGGTSSGAAPVIANIAKEMGKLTIAIVTMPFQFEGTQRIKQAKEGMEELDKNADLLLVIENEKMRELFGKLTFNEFFSKINLELTTAVEIIANTCQREKFLSIFDSIGMKVRIIQSLLSEWNYSHLHID